MLERRIEKLALKEESAKSIINLQEEAYNKGFTDMYIQCESTGLKIQKEAFEAEAIAPTIAPHPGSPNQPSIALPPTFMVIIFHSQ